MRRALLQAATWITVAAAVASAAWLVSVDPGWPDWRRLFAAEGAQSASALRAPTTSASPT